MSHDARNAPSRLIDVAHEAGVSRMAAAHVLNGTGGSTVRVSEATRQRVLEIARRLHYRPNRIAQQLRGARSRMLGVIYDTWNLPVMSARLAALEQEASRRQYRLMIGQVRRDPAGIREYLDDFEGRGVEGIICLFDLMRGYDRQLRPLFHPGLRVVFYGKPILDDAGCVRVDTADGVRQAVAHLLDRGRKRPALVMWNAADEKSALRREGYRDEMKGRGLPVDRKLMWSAGSRSGTPSQDVLDRAIETLVRERRADALIADDDVWAVRLIQRLKDRGCRVPDDVAVVGYDNLELATVIDPPLTTMDQDHDACARAMLGLLLEMVEQDGKPLARREITIKPKLIVRKST
ncbi:MAG: LacI family DNA-binding transcriptional regulator [Pirellulales bacterium]|nr:LacI family DNA-binding transcriptional regulator [Pirellulales bacterium]